MSKNPTKPQSTNRLLLDLAGQNHPGDAFRLRDSFENVFISGSTGSGKTSGSGYAIASAMLDCEGVSASEKIGMLVFLFKKEDHRDWLEWAWEHGREKDVVHIRAGDGDVLNLLERYQDAEPINAVNALMTISKLSATGSNHKSSELFWEVEQQKRLDRLLRLSQLAGLPLNIATLHKIHVSAPITVEQLNDEEFRKGSQCWQLLAKAAERVGQGDPGFQLVEDYFVREMPWLAEETASSIRAMVSGILEPFVSSSMLNRMFCGQSKLKLEDAFTGKIILVDIPIQIHEHLGRISAVMLKHAFQVAVEQRDLKQFPNPLIFWQDEAQAYLTNRDHAFMSTCRSSRAGSVILTQNISNLYAALGGGPQSEAQVNSLLALCNLKIFHANNDHITNEWAAKTIGQGIRNLSSIGISQDSRGSSATSSQQIHFLVEPREFTMLRNGGEENGFQVDAIVAGTGRVFSTGANYLPTTFEQPFAR